jgi:hypothetical protein
MTLTRPNSFFDWSVNLFEISTYLASLARAILNTYVSPGKATCKAFWQGHQTRMCSIRLMAGIRCSRAGKANPSARCMNGTLPCGRGPAFRAASQTDTGLRGALGGTRTLGRTRKRALERPIWRRSPRSGTSGARASLRAFEGASDSPQTLTPSSDPGRVAASLCASSPF